MPVTAGDDDELTTASQGINCRTIWEAQTRDPTTKELVKFLDPKDKESNKWPESKIKAMMTRTKKFVLRDGFIFRNGDKYINRKQLYVPKVGGIREQIMKHLPDNILSRHMGIERTYIRIRQRYYWEGMKVGVGRHVSRCT